jgi:H+/Cl- antiporter ClcA
MMQDYQFWTLVAMFAGGYGWMFIYFNKKFDKIDSRLSDIERRLTIVETIISMNGYLTKSRNPSNS